MNNQKIAIGEIVVVFLASVFLITQIRKEAKRIALRNVNDSLILLVELATEPGENYIQAEITYGEMLRRYVRHMQGRETPSFLLSPNIAKELGHIQKDCLSKEDVKIFVDRSESKKQKLSQRRIKMASRAITKLLYSFKLSREGPTPIFEPEAISREIEDAIRHSLKEAHEKAEIYTNNPNMVNAETLYRASQKAIVYFYLVRFDYQKIITQEKLKKFRTDLNGAIYHNQALRNSDIVKIDEDKRSRLFLYSDNELRYLRLLQTIMDNDIQQAHALLQIMIARAPLDANP